MCPLPRVGFGVTDLKTCPSEGGGHLWAQLVQALGVWLFSTWIKTLKFHSCHLAQWSHRERKEMLLVTHYFHDLETFTTDTVPRAKILLVFANENRRQQACR